MHGVPMEQVDALAMAGIVHGFTSRAGGVSVGPLSSLNLAARPGEKTEFFEENLQRVAASLVPGWGSDRIALLEQVHGAAVVRVSCPWVGGRKPVAEADAAFTTDPGVVLAVRTADCVPVLFAWPGGVGVAHAGWRGVAANIVGEWMRVVEESLGVSSGDVRAGIGPAISGDAYEVGPDVVSAIEASGVPAEHFLVARHGARPHVNLRRAVRQQLLTIGMQRIDIVPRCTAMDPQLFSHRADGPATGRQAGVIARVS